MNSIIKTLRFTKSQKAGLLILFILIFVMQLMIHFVDFSEPNIPNKEGQNWTLLQQSYDSINNETVVETPKIYPFNPNFITDFKGYKLGMSTAEIDRLLAFRKTNKYVNSASEFQMVTKVSDSLLNAISPYFKFPDWVKNKTNKDFNNYKESFTNTKTEPKKTKIIDINLATKEELMAVYGIGEGLSDRILKQKETFGAFVSMEQMSDVWGLSPEVIEKLNQSFKVLSKPVVQKIKINEASIKELGQFPYFRYPISKNIVSYRSMNGEIKNADDLSKVNGINKEKLNVMAQYLEF